MWLILGLGNPGAEYAGTRHNVGFDVVDALARRHRIDVTRQRHGAVFGRGRVAGQEVILAKPVTFMNLCGEAARPLLKFHGLDARALVVIHDEADHAPGDVRVKRGGGAAGHNGLTSLFEHLATRDFLRVRIGVGRPPGGSRVMADHVLDKPLPAERPLITAAVERAADAVEMVVGQSEAAAMRVFNRREDPPAGPAGERR